MVVAAGYLYALVPGTLVTVVGGLALITLGRSVLSARAGSGVPAAGLAVVAAAVGVGALRWGTLELAGLRGAQRVLGPTLAVGPVPVAIASALAAGACLLALACWNAPRAQSAGLDPYLRWAEAGLGALAVVTVFAEPSALVAVEGPGAAAVATAAAAVLAALVVGGGALLGRAPVPWRWAVLAASACATAAAGWLVVSGLR